MKTYPTNDSHQPPNARSVRDLALVSRGLAALLVILTSFFLEKSVNAQIYVGQQGNGRVGEYDVATGAAINATFITGLSTPYGIDFLGNFVFVASNLNNTVGEYNATTGAVINPAFITRNSPTALLISGSSLFLAYNFGGVAQYNANTGALTNGSLITGLSIPGELELLGNNLFVSDQSNNRVGLYNALTGAVISPNFISLTSPWGLALAGNNLFVSQNNGTVGLYNATTGVAINSSFITGLNQPLGLAISGNNLFVANFGSGTVGEYNATTGAAINPSFITGLSSPVSIAVRPVPEPSTWAMLMGGLSLLSFRGRFSRRKTQD